MPAETLTGLERAARFVDLQMTVFGGKVNDRTVGVNKTGGARFNLTRLTPIRDDIQECLTGVAIECLGWREFICRWDRPDMLFCL